MFVTAGLKDDFQAKAGKDLGATKDKLPMLMLVNHNDESGSKDRFKYEGDLNTLTV